MNFIVFSQAFIGRPVLWGLAHSGVDGVKSIIQLLKTEFDLAMALSGTAKESDTNLIMFSSAVPVSI